MEKKHHYMTILDLCMVLVTFAYVSFAVGGYLSFGDGVQSIITSNIQPLTSHPVYYVVEALIALEVMASYPVQMFPVVEMAETAFAQRYSSYRELRRYALRTGVVLLTLLMALFVPYFSLVVNLIGAASNTFAGFILPPVYYMKICWKDISRAELGFNIFLIVFGLVGGGIASGVSVQQIIHCIATDGQASGCK